MAHTGELMESLEIAGDMIRPVHKYSTENDINKLFDTIDIKNAYRALLHSEKNLKDGFSKSAMKRPMKVKSGHKSGIGISESASLKQALRGLCISHASKMAAMKKQLSKATPFSSRISNAGSIKSLYRAVMFNASANDGVVFKNRSNVNVSKDTSVPLSSIVGRDGLYARAELDKSLKLRNASFGSSSNTKLPVLDENVCDSDDVPCSSQEGKSTVSDLTFVNNESNNPRVFRTNNIVDNRLELDSITPSVGFSCCYSGDGHCTSSCWSSDSPETSSSRTTCVDSVANKSIYRHKTNDRSRSRRKGKMSFSSKSSIGDNRSSVSSSEESVISGLSCKSYKPHMSKDLRWKAIEYIEQKQGSLGLKHFKLLKKIGGGDIGNIYLSMLIGTNCVFALKVMDIDLLASRRKLTRAQTEKEILQMLDHPFLPSLYAHFTTEKFLCLVMEYCPGGDLHVLRQKQLTQTFSEQATRFYIAEVVLALEYLHMLGVVYRDLKPENVLVREDGHIMLTDFDLSLKSAVSLTILKTEDEHPKPRLSRPSLHVSCIDPFCRHTSLSISCFNAKFVSVSAKTRNPKFEATTLPQLIVEPIDARSNSLVGTHEYLAPEIIKGEGHGSAVDWWTLGILLYEFLYGKTPFKARNDDEDTLTNIVSDTLKFPETPDISSNARDLIRCLLKKEPQQRLGFEKGAAEIKQHPFFQGMNWALIRCETPPHVPKSYDMGSCNLGISGYNIENERRLGDYTMEEDIVLETF